MTPAHRLQNALRIMMSLDEVDTVLGDRSAAFHRDPIGTAIRMDSATWERVFALIEARQPQPRADLIRAQFDMET